MAITDRNLSAGTKLWARYRGQVHTAEVVETEDVARDLADAASPDRGGPAGRVARVVVGSDVASAWWHRLRLPDAPGRQTV